MAHYGARLFAFVIAEGPYLLSDDQLVLAAAAGVRASADRGIAPQLADRLSHYRHNIAAVQRIRAAMLPAEPVTLAGGIVPHVPNVGPMAPLSPVPRVQPPSGDAIRLSPAQRQAVSDNIAF
jgi:hypothetical protein